MKALIIFTLILCVTGDTICQIQGTLRRKTESNGLLTGLVSCWEFDEGSGTTASDELAVNDYTLTGATWTAGIMGNCISFDGVNDYIKTPVTNAYNFDADAEDYTLNFWLKSSNPNSGGHSNNYLIHYWTGVLGQDYPFNVVWIPSINSFQFVAYNGQTTYPVNCVNNGDFWDGNWHMWTMVRDDANNRIKVYFDGSLYQDDSEVITNYENTYSMTMNNGYARDNAGRYFDGDFDQFGIWNRALTATDILNLYNSGSGLPYSSWD